MRVTRIFLAIDTTNQKLFFELRLYFVHASQNLFGFMNCSVFPINSFYLLHRNALYGQIILIFYFFLFWKIVW